MKIILTAAAAWLLGMPLAQEGAKESFPIGEPVVEASTWRTLGIHWIIRGDANGNANIDVDVRTSGSGPWTPGLRLFRVEKGHHLSGEWGSPLTRTVPADARLFAG